MKLRSLISHLLIANMVAFTVLCWVVAYQNPNLNDLWVLITAARSLWP